jgi:large subunit ribosomal protein L31
VKQKLHPKYEPVTITCMGCQTKVVTRSTRGKDFSIDVCSSCHPFFTGKQKYVDAAGRIERFQKKWAKATAASAAKAAAQTAAKTATQAAPEAPKAEAAPQAESEAPQAAPEVKA